MLVLNWTGDWTVRSIDVGEPADRDQIGAGQGAIINPNPINNL